MTSERAAASVDDPAGPDRTTVETADGPMPAWLWRPPTGTGPGIVVVQEIFGVSDYVQSRCADLAALGYVVLAPDVYWRLPGSDHTPEGEGALPQAMALVGQVDWPTAVADVRAGVQHLRGMIEVNGAVGLVGFCFGGGLAFNVAAVEPVDALVSYYGSALPGLLPLADQVDAPSLHHFGTGDAYIPVPAQDEIRAAVTARGARFESYPDAGHAFDNPDPQFHHAAASARAWATTVQFLAEHLSSRAG